jgi:hypothetical protein
MTVGLPGVGLGGIFYLLSAALMPVRELVRAVRRERPSRWSLVLRQTAMTAGILGALWLTGWMLGLVIATSPTALVASGHTAVRSSNVHNALRVGALVLSLGTLLLVLASVQIARLLVRRPAQARIPAQAMIEMRVLPQGSTPPPSRAERIDSGTFGRAGR